MDLRDESAHMEESGKVEAVAKLWLQVPRSPLSCPVFITGTLSPAGTHSQAA